MIMNSVKIQNYKALKNVEVPLSSFVCIIGENNSGKSSILSIIHSFIEDSKIYEKDFYNSSEPIRVELELSSITEDDLQRIDEDQKDKIQSYIITDKLKLIKIFTPGNKPKSFVITLVPKDERLNYENIKDKLGNTGTAIQEYILNHLSEYKDVFEGVNTKTKVKEKIELIIDNLPKDQLEETEKSLPSATTKLINTLLPEPIFIQAVKDVNDDIKTKDSATFGKLMSALIDLIEEKKEFEDITESFEKLNKLLNTFKTDDGIMDERIDGLKEIEELVNFYLKENFQNADLEINVPPPELKKVFSSAEIFVDDGIKGLIESKGDGLKRAVTFALFRSFYDLKKRKVSQNTDLKEQSYLFLFEEPELYLHPAAQKILFKALSNIAIEGHQVVVTTHSPFFLSHESTETFVKVKKSKNIDKPFSKIIPLNLQDITLKDTFQLICIENNNAAFFSDRILLVEGDSDLIFFKHISKILDDLWDFDVNNIPVIRLHGKGNARRYKNFFELFEIDVHMILDQDIITKDFDKLDVPNNIKIQHEALMDELRDIILEEGSDGSPQNRQEVERIIENYTLRDKYEKVKEITAKVTKTKFMTAEQASYMDELYKHLFSAEENKSMKRILNSEEFNSEIKYELLTSLHNQNIYVLSKGSLEDYYPRTDVKGKLPKALKACELLTTKEEIIENCPIINGEKTEFELIFSNIFK